MSTFGLTTTGFVQKQLTDILAEIEEQERATFGRNINVLPSSVLGQLNGIYADKLSEVWEQLNSVYSSQYPAQAFGMSLDDICALTGVYRLPSSNSSARVLLFINPAVTVPAGTLLRIGQTGSQFKTTANVTNGTGIAALFSATTQAVDVGQVIADLGAINNFATPVAGLNFRAVAESQNVQPFTLSPAQTTLLVRINGAAAQTVTFTSNTNITAATIAAEINTALGAGTAYAVDGRVQIIATTSVEITGGTSNAILQFPVALSGGVNPLAATVGRNIETDEELRARRAQLLSSGGTATVEAIRSAVLSLSGVNQVTVYENTTLVTDVNGVPAKAFETIVDDGAAVNNQTIAKTIFDNKAAGIQAYGVTVTETVIDSQGFPHVIQFSRPTLINIYITARVDVDLNTFSTLVAARDAVRVAINAYFSALLVGADVIFEKLKSQVLDIDGVLDLSAVATPFAIATTPAPTGTVNIVLPVRQRAVTQNANIVTFINGVLV